MSDAGVGTRLEFPEDDALRAVEAALDEDLAGGPDETTETIFASGREVAASVVAREACVVAGVRLARIVIEAVARRVGHRAVVSRMIDDGIEAAAGAALLEIRGEARNVLVAERTVLNFLARTAGIATLTRDAVREVAGIGCRIADTRKTTPGLRAIEKYAVACGGGENHRMGLSGSIFVKDNHKDLAGGLGEALRRLARAGVDPSRCEVEIDSLDELNAPLEFGAGWILLDNMSLRDVRTAVGRVAGRAKIEVSGGLRPGRLREIAEAGVDRISLGVLTHGARAMDLALEIEGGSPR